MYMIRQFIQQFHCLSRARDPGCCACQSCFEVICARREELIADMQRFATFDATEVFLAR